MPPASAVNLGGSLSLETVATAMRSDLGIEIGATVAASYASLPGVSLDAGFAGIELRARYEDDQTTPSTLSMPIDPPGEINGEPIDRKVNIPRGAIEVTRILIEAERLPPMGLANWGALG